MPKSYESSFDGIAVVGISPLEPDAYLRTCKYTILQEITDGKILLDD